MAQQTPGIQTSKVGYLRTAYRGCVRALEAVSSRFSPAGRSALAVLLVLCIAAWAALPNVFVAGDGVDDVTWAKRSLASWAFKWPRAVDDGWAKEGAVHGSNHRWSSDYYRDYYYAIDHPAVARIVYGGALAIMDVKTLDIEDWDYSADWRTNLASGRILPYPIRTGMRLTNFVLYCGTLVLVYFGLEGIVRNRFLALAGVSVLAGESTLTIASFGVVPYIGADAAFIFCLALSWFVWVKFKAPSLTAAAVVGLAAGVATATKINGAFIVMAVMAYFAIASRGRWRVVNPAAAALSAVVIYLALNPVYLGGGVAWTQKVVGDVLARRVTVMHEHLDGSKAFLSWDGRLFTMLPYVYFIVPAAAMIRLWGNAGWLRATIFWSVSIMAGNLCLLYMYLPKYVAPIRVAFWILFLSAGLMTVKEGWRKLFGMPPIQGARPCAERQTLRPDAAGEA